MYFGSVKFFKNLLLFVIILAIGISAGFAIYYHHQWVQVRPTGESSASGTHSSYAPVDTDEIDYQTLYPDFYAPQTYCATDRQAGKIYLTFDGAVSSATDELLSILSQRNVQATFFLSGAADAQTLKAIAAAGHTIGMSSWSADYQTLYHSVSPTWQTPISFFRSFSRLPVLRPQSFASPAAASTAIMPAFTGS